MRSASAYAAAKASQLCTRVRRGDRFKPSDMQASNFADREGSPFTDVFTQGWKSMVKEVFAPLLNRPVKRDWRPACQLLFLVVLLAAKSNAQGHPGTPSLPTLPSGAPAN